MSKQQIKPLPTPSVPLPERPARFKPSVKKLPRLTLKKKKIIIAFAKTGSYKKAAEMAKSTPAYASQVVNSPRGQLELAPVIDLMSSHRMALLEELKRREAVLSQEDYKTLLAGVDILTKNHQLLSGGATENVAVADVTEKYNQLINEVKNNG